LTVLGAGVKTALSAETVQQIAPAGGDPACERSARTTLKTMGPTLGPVRTRARVILQLPRGVCEVHAPVRSLPKIVQLGAEPKAMKN
jgi:hypothetical protein